jgi:hypothetical protein
MSAVRVSIFARRRRRRPRRLGLERGDHLESSVEDTGEVRDVSSTGRHAPGGSLDQVAADFHFDYGPVYCGRTQVSLIWLCRNCGSKPSNELDRRAKFGLQGRVRLGVVERGSLQYELIEMSDDLIARGLKLCDGRHGFPRPARPARHADPIIRR